MLIAFGSWQFFVLWCSGVDSCFSSSDQNYQGWWSIHTKRIFRFQITGVGEIRNLDRGKGLKGWLDVFWASFRASFTITSIIRVCTWDWKNWGVTVIRIKQDTQENFLFSVQKHQIFAKKKRKKRHFQFESSFRIGCCGSCCNLQHLSCSLFKVVWKVEVSWTYFIYRNYQH